jgi:hypothetical protein
MLATIRPDPVPREQFRRRAATKHSALRAGVARPTANLGKHLHRRFDLDFRAGELGDHRDRGMIRPPQLIEPSHRLRDEPRPDVAASSFR